jgi:hypothetical protein
VSRPALDRIPEDLLAMSASDALAKVALWLEDCDDHMALDRLGGLPVPPFKLSEAWVVVRLVAEARCDFTIVEAGELVGARR